MSETFELVKEKLGKPYHDLEYILHCLKEVLIEHGEKELAGNIPWINASEAPSRQDITQKQLHLYSICFQILNLVEVNGAVQDRREKEEAAMDSVNGLFTKNFKLLQSHHISQQQILDAFDEIMVEPVLTAHPTQSKRPVVLEHYRELYLLIVRRENKMYTRVEQEEITRDIKQVLHGLWHIGEIFMEKPRIESELDNTIHYLKNVFPDAVLLLYRRLVKSWEAAGFDPELIYNKVSLPRITFGNWVGGDRDGHPLVTAEVTRNTLKKLRLNAFLILKENLSKLAKRLSMYVDKAETSASFQKRLNQLITESGNKANVYLEDFSNEAFRLYVNLLILKLPVESCEEYEFKLIDSPYVYTHSWQLIEDVLLLQQALIDYDADPVARVDVTNTIRMIETFGFHLAHLDIRQNSAYYEKAFAQVLDKAENMGGAYLEWVEDQKKAFLDKELATNKPFLRNWQDLPEEAAGVLDSFQVLDEHIQHYTHLAFGSLIISMANHVNDLYVVYLLAREAGLTVQTEMGMACKLPVTPLFETIEDLEQCHLIMDEYLSHPVTQSTLEYQKKINRRDFLLQEVMIGYSDSNKDGGIIASTWFLHQAQVNMTQIAEKHGVRISFFHGKGGSISRGAGPVHWFLKTLPHSSINGQLRLTEQGETIERKYANKVNAVYNLELLMAGTLSQSLLHWHSEKTIHQARETLEYMAQESIRHYKSLIENKHFMTFFRQATPIEAIETSKIGSRPSRRSGKRSLDDLRAIPWVFSWRQSRFNLTSWFGVGKTLERMQEQYPDRYRQIRELVPTDPYIRYLLTNIDTSIAATDENIMERYASLVEDAEARHAIMEILLDELQRTRKMLGELLGRPMEERRKNHYYSTELRARALDYLHHSQVELLRSWRKQKQLQNKEEAEKTQMKLFQCINAIANAMGNTG